MKKTNFTKLLCFAMMLFGFSMNSEVAAQAPAGQTQISVTYTVGGFNAENSWVLWDATAGAELLCGGNNPAGGTTTAFATDGNDLELYTYETFGDGWCPPGNITVETAEDGSANLCNAQNFVIYDGPSSASGNGFFNCGDGDPSTATANGGPGVLDAAFTVSCLQCEVTCPNDVTTINAPGVCEGYVSSADATISADCAGLGGGSAGADWACAGNVAPGTSLVVTLPGSGPPADPTFMVTVEFGINADINSCAFESFAMTDGAGNDLETILGPPTFSSAFMLNCGAGGGFPNTYGSTSFNDQCGASTTVSWTMPYSQYEAVFTSGPGTDGVAAIVAVGTSVSCTLCAGDDLTMSVSWPLDPTVDHDSPFADVVGGPNASGTYPVGTTVVTYTTFDSNGNPVTCQQTITVLDTEAPALTCPGDETIHLDGGDCDKGYTYNVSAVDNCPSDPFTVVGPYCDPCVAPTGGSALACSGGTNSIIQIISAPAAPGTEVTEMTFNQETFGTTNTATVNLYCYDGVNVPFTGGGFTAFATATVTLSNADNGGCVTVAFAPGQFVPAGCTEIAVEVFTPFGRAVQTPATCGGNTADGNLTYIVGPACGLTVPGLFSGIGFALDAGYTLSFLPQALEAQPDPLAPADYNQYASGDNLPIGQHCFQWEATDASGNQAICTWCVDVLEYSNPTDNLSCNQNLNHSVNADCEFIMTPDMILEGGPYACYENYTVTITGAPAIALVGNGTNAVTVKASQLPGFPANGMAGPYDIMVADENGNSCWGAGHMFEDKLAPIITCDTVTIACTTSTEPGGTPESDVASGSNADALSWGDGATGLVGELSIPVSGVPAGADLNGLTVDLNMDHSWVGDLDISLTSPSGITVTLVQGNCGVNDNISCTFDDNAANPISCAAQATAGPHEDCPGDWANAATINNDVQPVGTLADFAGGDINGTWTLSVTDNVGGDGGCIDVAGLSINADWTLQAVTDPTIVENCGAYVAEYEDAVTNNACGEEFSQVIERTWTVTDAKGNSAQCVQVINVKFATLGDIAYPENRDNLEGDALDCGNADTDPSNTGEPTGAECGNIGCTYSDSAPIPLCGGGSGSYKILRTWTCIDWCTGEIDTEPQIIKVIDDEAPTLNCGADLDVSTDNASCEATVLISAPSWTDNCDSDIDLEVSVSSGTVTPNGPNWVITGLPVGTHTVTWTGTDGCNNVTTCDYTITVTDQTPPVAICETFHTVSLTVAEPTIVWAAIFDDGSYDNCGPVTFDVRRMTSCIDFDWTTAGAGNDANPNGVVNDADEGTGNPNSQTTGWYPAIPVACCDVGNDFMVAFRVTDSNGNRNTCMVNVTVQDKIDGVINCPEDKDYDCDIDIQASSDLPLDGVSATDNGGLPTYYYNGASWDFVGYYLDAYDNCDANVYILDRGGINNCGESYLSNPDFPGNIRRYFAVIPANIPIDQIPTVWNQFTSFANNNDGDFCTQQLGVINPNDFDENDINWPNDVTVDCPVDPSNTGEPSFNDDACSNVHFTAEPDILIPLNNDTACYKILRTWIVIDWCQYDGNGAGYWTDTQVIKVQDQEAPTIDSGCDNVVVDIDTDNDGNFSNGCTGDVELEVNGSDNCAGEDALEWTWELDADNDGTVNSSGSGNSNTFNNLPLGTHSVTWTLSDGCGNYDQCTQLVVVQDNTPPLVYGDYGMEVNLAGGNATLWANDFDEGSSDECSDICDMRIASPSGGPGQTAPPTTTSVSFDCDDLGNNTIDFWVKDCANNWAYVSSFVIIQDNNLECTNPGFDVVGGMNNELGEGVEGVNVDLTGYMTGTATTAADGQYSFLNLIANQNYTVTPTEDLPVLNGISTWDLVLISKHVLQIEFLDSPYKIIAADVNTSGNVSTLDMVELRKLILLIETEFPNNDASWRFVPANFVFPDATDPWVNGSSFPEVASINDLSADMVENFVAIKKGDVNNSAIPNQLIGGEDRTMTGDLVFNINDRAMEAGQEYTVDFNANDFSEILGYQFSLAFDTDAVEFVGVDAGSLSKLTEANFGFAKLDEGVITTSWNNQVATNLKDNDVVFSVTFKALANTQLSDVINISSRFTAAEAYNDNLELLDVAIEYNQDGQVVTANNFALFQNTPNPFKDATVISFTLPEAQAASLKVYDVSGRILHAVSGDYAKGYNEVVINRSDLNGSGVLYYQLDTDSDSATKKMIIIE